MISGNLIVDVEMRRVEVEGNSAELEPKVYELLLYLLTHANQVATKDQLIEAVWNGRVVSDGALTQTVAKLRKALSELEHHGGLIKTIPKVGYRWEGDVQQPAQPAAEPEAVSSATARTPEVTVQRGRTAWLVGLAIAVVLVVSLFTSSTSEEQVTVAMMPFAAAADSDLEWTQLGLPSLIGDTMGARTNIRVVSASRVQSSLRSLGLSTDSPLSERLAAVRSLMGADHLLQAQVDREGGTYRLSYTIDGVDSKQTSGLIETKRLDDLAYNLVAQISEDLDVQYEAGIPARKVSNVDYFNETFARGMQALLSGDSDGARVYFETALEGDETMSWARYELANALQYLGQWEEAKAAYTEVVTRAQEDGDLNLAGAAASGLGIIAWRQGDLSAAESFFERAREWFTAVDNRANLASALGNLGILADNRQAWDDARNLYGEALSLYRTQGERFGESAVYSNLAVLERKLGQIDKAAEFQAKAIEIQQSVGLKQMLVFSLNHAGTIEANRGNWAEGAAWLEQAQALAAEQEDPIGVADALSSRASLLIDQLALADAEVLLDDALAAYSERSHKYGEGRTKLMLGEIAQLRGNLDLALQQAGAAKIIAEELEDKALLLSALLAEAKASTETRKRNLLAEAQYVARDVGNDRSLALYELARTESDDDKTLALTEALRLARSSGDRRLEAITAAELGLQKLEDGSEGVGALLATAESWQSRYFAALHLRACYLMSSGDAEDADRILSDVNRIAAEASNILPLDCP